MRQPGGGGVGMINQPLGTGLVSCLIIGLLRCEQLTNFVGICFLARASCTAVSTRKGPALSIGRERVTDAQESPALPRAPSNSSEYRPARY